MDGSGLEIGDTAGWKRLEAHALLRKTDQKRINVSQYLFLISCQVALRVAKTEETKGAL
jgi:hypothetical protein